MTSITGGNDQAAPIKQPMHIRLWFGSEGGHGLGWEAGCNEDGGSVHITATTLEVDQVGGTLVGCETKVEEQEAWFASFMEADPEWRLEGERLRLTSDRGTIELKGFQDPGKCLISPSGGWVDLGNSGLGCEETLGLVAAHEEGKDRYLSGWTCRDGESQSGQAKVLCVRGKRRFEVHGFDLVAHERG